MSTTPHEPEPGVADDTDSDQAPDEAPETSLPSSSDDTTVQADDPFSSDAATTPNSPQSGGLSPPPVPPPEASRWPGASTPPPSPAPPPPAPPAPPRAQWGASSTTPAPPSTPPSAQPEPRARAPWWVLPLVVLAAIALVGGGALAGWALSERESTEQAESPAASESETVPVDDGGEAGIVPDDVVEPVAAVAEAVAPSVVQIDTDFGLGSGIIMDDEGHIVTAAHVIQGANAVRVRLADGTMVEASIVGTHPETDVGVVAIDPRPGLVPAVLGVDADIAVGQMAVAVGSPFGLEQTVTSGIVSALDRPVETEATYLVGMIQTDASINPGNSGGALADRHGRVIGINDAIRTQGGGNEGVGFAIPIDLAISVADRLIDGEPIQSGFLGVSVREAVEGRPGALVQQVTPGTPADDAGIEVGDLIVSIDGQPIRGVRDLRASILALDPGTPVTVTVVRDGSDIDLDVVLTISEL